LFFIKEGKEENWTKEREKSKRGEESKNVKVQKQRKRKSSRIWLR